LGAKLRGYFIKSNLSLIFFVKTVTKCYSNYDRRKDTNPAFIGKKGVNINRLYE
jgi:hypothetical protein